MLLFLWIDADGVDSCRRVRASIRLSIAPFVEHNRRADRMGNHLGG